MPLLCKNDASGFQETQPVCHGMLAADFQCLYTGTHKMKLFWRQSVLQEKVGHVLLNNREDRRIARVIGKSYVSVQQTDTLSQHGIGLGLRQSTDPGSSEICLNHPNAFPCFWKRYPLFTSRECRTCHRKPDDNGSKPKLRTSMAHVAASLLQGIK